jgi:hypothetical protein
LRGSESRGWGECVESIEEKQEEGVENYAMIMGRVRSTCGIRNACKILFGGGGGGAERKRPAHEISVFWDVTQRRFVVIYRGFGTTYRSRNVGITYLRCVTSQKNKDLVYTAVEVGYHPDD